MLAAQDVISVGVRGISDGNRDGTQKDRQEAIMDAKRQAIEQAGLSITSTTKVENFQIAYDLIETQAAAVLLPGFQIIDNGYGEDGSYSVVLLGKVNSITINRSDKASFTILVWLYESGEGAEESYQLLDKLYSWLLKAHGEFSHNETTIESWENQLVSISRSDSTNDDKRFYAFSYALDAGTVIYTQKLSPPPNRLQRVRLRANLEYTMEVAAWNGIYFNDPAELKGSLTRPRLYGTYPDDFLDVP